MIVSNGTEVDLASLLVRLVDLGAPSEIRTQSPRIAGEALDLDRVLLSTLRDGELCPVGLHLTDADPQPLLELLRERSIRIEYPLVEGELMRRRRARVIEVADPDQAGRYAFAELLEWTSYVAAPVILDGRIIGFFHADRRGRDPALSDVDAAALSSFAVGFALVYERAVLHHRIRVQRHEMRKVATWANSRSAELSERLITLGDDADDGHEPIVEPLPGQAQNGLRDLLTRREIEVLQLMVRGVTNSGIARELIVSEGTVKFHVKNILRKLHASNRAEATSRYLRLTLNRSPRPEPVEDEDGEAA